MIRMLGEMLCIRLKRGGIYTFEAKCLDVLGRAHSENCIILTFDRDYGELNYKHKLFSPVYFLPN